MVSGQSTATTGATPAVGNLSLGLAGLGKQPSKTNDDDKQRMSNLMSTPSSKGNN